MRVLGALLILIGAVNFPWSIAASAQAVTSAGWPTTVGTIESSSVRAASAGKGTTYIPTVAYAYEVKGKRFIGSRIWHMEFGLLQNDAQELANSLAVGSEVTVYFNAGDPSVSLLRPGLTRYSVGWIAISLLALVLGLALLRRRPRASAGVHAA
jgi:hypothetical protein